MGLAGRRGEGIRSRQRMGDGETLGLKGIDQGVGYGRFIFNQ
jgi:hypothetical protein